MAVARRRLLLAGACLTLATRARAQSGSNEERLQPVEDLRPLLAQVRRHRAPLLVLFSTPGCPFCLDVRRNYLAPRAAEQATLPAPTLLVREVDITSRATLIDSQGRRTTQADFAAQFGARVVPVVALFDDRGQVLGEPLVGIDRSGFYEGYLSAAIEQARKRLRP